MSFISFTTIPPSLKSEWHTRWHPWLIHWRICHHHHLKHFKFKYPYAWQEPLLLLLIVLLPNCFCFILFVPFSIKYSWLLDNIGRKCQGHCGLLPMIHPHCPAVKVPPDVQNNRSSNNASKPDQHWVIRIHRRPWHSIIKGCIYYLVPLIPPVGTMPCGQDKAAYWLPLIPP